MLKFHCDKCRKPMEREAAAQIRIVLFAYCPGAERIPIYRELCPDCALELDTILMPSAEEAGEREILKESWGWRDLAPGDNCKGETVHKDAGKCISSVQDPRCEGRCITIARVRADMKQHELAEKCYTEQATVSTWERGKIRPDWKMLEGILPELKDIRKKGCDAYCDHRDKCLVTGDCYYGRYRSKG